MTYFLPTVNRMNNRLVRVRDSRLLVVTTLLLQTPPFWKFPRPFTLTRPLGHGIKMEFWKMSGKLVEIQEMGRGGVVEGNMGCNGVPSRWSGSI